jgi:transcriptional regulator with XRE-family HTH domain
MLIADLHERIRLHVLATVKSGHLTQAALAQLIGVRQAHISNFLLGRRGLSIGGMDSVLTALGLDVADLLAMSGQKRVGMDCATTLENVPLIQLGAAMRPTFAKDEILGELGFNKLLLRRLKAVPADQRRSWARFVAIRANNALAAQMHPRFSNGSVLLVDRHCCMLTEYRKDGPNLYMTRKEKVYMVRWAEMHGTQLCLRPECSKYPLDFICIDRKTTLASCIVGRVAHITTET